METETNKKSNENKSWLCIDCDVDTSKNARDSYVVKNKLWEKKGVKKGKLCMECFEKRLGRKLMFYDLKLSNTNVENPYTTWIIVKYFKDYYIKNDIGSDLFG